MDTKRVNRVEAYFRSEMTDREAMAFQSDLETDTELKRIFQEYQLAMEAIDYQVEDELKKRFEVWEQEASGSETMTRSLMPQVWKIAASLVLVVSVIYLINNFIKESPTSGIQLAENFYQVPQSPGAEMGKGEELWSNGLAFYSEGDFQSALNLWSQITDPTLEQLYFMAHVHFIMKDFNKSDELFRAVSASSSVYSFDADWFLALSLLADEEESSFEEQINKMTSNPGHPYHEDAEKLLMRARKLFARD